MESQFPPRLAVGTRVWTVGGYTDHGPAAGPKVDIAGNMGGTIAATEKPYPTDQLLYTVRWDNGQISKHYASGLHCIGRFDTRAEFEAMVEMIELEGAIELTFGPQGGFREARMRLKFDGTHQDVHLYQGDRDLWVNRLEPLAERQRASINITRLPHANRKG